jgi:hypothetical protein
MNDFLNEFAKGNYPHLQIFLHRNFKCQIGKKFLLVSPTSFGLVIVKDLNYENGFVIVQVLDCFTGLVGNVRINIKNARPRVLFICYDDVKSLILNENNFDDDTDLLEFDY